MITPDWRCFCLGAGEDVSFEQALFKQYRASVFLIDPTPRAIDYVKRIQASDPLYQSPQFQLLPVGVWSENKTMKFYTPQDPAHVSHSILNMQHTETYFEAECVTPSTLLQRTSSEAMDLLKLNVEGAEYAIIDALFQDRIYPKVICITFDELHTGIDSGANKRLRMLGKKFKDAGYVPISAYDARVTYLRQELK
jgi:FkbM family methyltransferase